MKERNLNGNATENPDCPEAVEPEGLGALILNTEVARMVRATSKQETQHD
jgi:hypothetical protein